MSAFVKLVDGQVSEVLVMSFEDGVTLWRGDLLSSSALDTPSFFFSNCDGRRSTLRYGDTHYTLFPDGSKVWFSSSFLLSRSGAVERTVAPTRHLRTALEFLGALRTLQTPMMIGADLAPKPTPQNPYVGVFSAETEIEAMEVAGRIVRELQVLGRGAVQICREPLFSDRTSLWVRNSVPKGCLEAMVRRPVVRWQGHEKGFVETHSDMSEWRSFTDARDLYSWLSLPDRRRDWFVLPRQEALAWWSENTVPFTSSIPLEELEISRLLGETIPWLWPSDRLSAWAAERWS